MKWIRVGFLFAILGVMGVSLGCNPFRRSKPAPPPPTPQAKPLPEIQVPPTTPPPEKPEPLPPPPKIQEPSVTSVPPPPIETATPQPPPQKPPTRSQAPPPAPPLEPTEPTEVPRLTQLLTPEQQKDYNHEIDESLERVRQNLNNIRGRSLNEEQKTVLSRIQAFVKQTQEARKADLVTAQSLAQRADLLAQDLVRNLQ